jgi:glycosyltransferase involved in cell wall biosynthesis
MACGAPTVARDTVFNREVLGPAGTYVGGDAHSIAAEIAALLTDDERRRKLSAAGVQRVEERYTWERVCAGYEQALGELIRLPGHGLGPATSVGTSSADSE